MLVRVGGQQRVGRHDRDVGAGHPAPLLGRGAVGDPGHGARRAGRRPRAPRPRVSRRRRARRRRAGSPTQSRSRATSSSSAVARGAIAAGSRTPAASSARSRSSTAAGLVGRARAAAGGEQEDRPAVEGVAARGEDGQPDVRQEPPRRRDAVVGEVPVAQRVPLAAAQGAGVGSGTAAAACRPRSARRARARRPARLVAVVHQPVDVDHDAGSRARRRTEAARPAAPSPHEPPCGLANSTNSPGASRPAPRSSSTAS